MKATTTVTTSSYYGATTTNTGNIRSTQSTLNAFIPPQQMLRRLLPYANTQKQKENIKPPRQQIPPSSQQPPINRNAVILDIENLQSELNNIHAEIIESENLLNVRDSLYGQLDLLREEREQIESDVGYLENQYSSSNEVRVNVKANHGYKEMNERLRRRTAEIREYIHKMELQNRKIEQNINYTNMLNIQKNYRTQINTNNAWIDNAYLDQRQRGTGRIDDLISRLHLKQEEALQRVRKQEDEINRRNQLNRASFSSSNLMMGTQGGARSYYGATGENSSVGRRRFYSPEYRY